MKIFVDGDGCPVVDLTIEIAKSYDIDVVVVKNYCHEIYDDYANIITVDKSSDSADYYIVNNATNGDIVVTQDYGLAAMALAKNAMCITQNGLIITSDNINQLLERRHFNREMRRKHNKYTKFKKRDTKSDIYFENNLRKLIENLKK
ncbi:YaiI/YqxD family protein [Anaerosalibacter sp. Marseille-P3206]|uniref:YaiI/YqxD family protein n=1 Tax=Anaerosalibacter sp. Marseille-P3206 TaxID=1871005 RepID=UPI0009868D7B|nr:DUF188 domain-containing protein [Anaerosalibacter sp. Marseille-P3206]